MGEKFTIHLGDQIDGFYNNEKNAIVGHMPKENDKPTLDNLPYGEKKTLYSFYSLDDKTLNCYTFYKVDDLWQAYYNKDNYSRLSYAAASLFDVCCQIIFFSGNEDLAKRYFYFMNYYTKEEEINKFIERLKEKQGQSGPKLSLVPQTQNKEK